ncbi:hypothetical protein TB1_009332 [Malus domestica]
MGSPKPKPLIRAAPNKTSTIYGVAGTIRLLTGNYVLLITSWTEVATNLGFPVCRVTSMRFLSCNEGMKNSTAQEGEAYFMALLKTVQSTPGLYFSIRGSIPLLWEQIVDLSYKRQLRIITHEQTVICCQIWRDNGSSIPFYSFLGFMVQFP